MTQHFLAKIYKTVSLKSLCWTTWQLNTLRGSILEEVVPGIKVNSKDRGIHSKEVIEFMLPEVQLQW